MKAKKIKRTAKKDVDDSKTFAKRLNKVLPALFKKQILKNSSGSAS